MAPFKKLLIIILLISIFQSSFCNIDNNSNVQKLVQDFEKAKTDETRNFQLSILMYEINELPFEEATKHLNNLYIICDTLNYNYGKGFTQFFQALLQMNNGYYLESYYSLEKSLTNYKKAKDINGEACVLGAIGDLHKRLNNYDISIDYYKESAELFKSLKDTIKESQVYQNLGAIYAENNQLQEAKKYLNIAIKSFTIQSDTIELIPCFINLGEVYRKENKLDSAIFYFRKSLNFSKISGSIVDSVYAQYFLGKLYLLKNDLELAKPLLASVYEQLNKNNEIVPIDELSEINKTFALYYQKIGDSNQAILNLNKAEALEIENKIIQTTKEINQLKVLQLEKEKKLVQNRSRWTMNISIAGFLGSILLLFAFYRSYKHKKEANRLLSEMDELKNRLYSNITHELRTPLTLILGPLEQMLSSETEKIPSRKQVKMMRKNADSLLGLVNQMLDLSKIDAKNMKLELVEADINKFLRTRFAAFASLAEQKSINYHCSLLNEKNIRIFDSQKLEKIVNNLLSNAIKFTPKNGEISCYANFNQPNSLELIVQDDGKGISNDELGKIFDRFHQANTNDDIINIGTGIGLSLTKELVELMHGKIIVESEPGTGSKFTVTLPLGTEHLVSDEFQMIQNLNTKIRKNTELSEAQDIAEEYNNIQDSHREKQDLPLVLIVEDNIDIREFVAESLSDSFIIEKAGNGKTGLKRAIKKIPDLVITDIVMPKMDGIELCNNLKTDERTSHIPVVMLTGKTGIENRLQGLENGADAYLTKPFNIKELHLQVSNLIEQRQKLRERFTRDLRLEPKDIAVTSADEKFIMRAMEIIEKNMGNSEFEVRQFQDEMYMSRMQLFRKIKALTNQTPGEFIRTIRLKRAASLLKQNFGNIAQITYEVGFNNPSYFARCFKDLFGELPSDFIKNQHG